MAGSLLMSSTDCSLRQARETNSASMSCENHFDSERRMRVTVRDKLVSLRYPVCTVLSLQNVIVPLKCVLWNSAYQLKSGCLVKTAFVFSIRNQFCVSLLQEECYFLLFSVWMKTA